MTETAESPAPKKGWELLHSKLPQNALKEVPESVYKVKGLSDVNEGYLFARLFASGLGYEWRIVEQTYLGHEDRTSRSGNTNRWYMAAVHGVLIIDGREFHGSGAHDNMRLDAAFKGAATVAFKNATKVAGMWNELLMNGRAMDFIYATKDGDVMEQPASGNSTASSASSGSGSSSTQTSAPSSATPSATDSTSSAAKPTLSLTKRQNAALGYLVKWTRPEPAGELPTEMNAKVRAFEKALAHLVAHPDDQPGAFEAAALELCDMHAIACGPNCAHATAVKGQLEALKADVEQQQAA